MSNFTKARVSRSKLTVSFTEATYRKAKPHLLKDFEQRCAYSLQHMDRVGYRCIEVDHFNPNLRGARRHNYSNLFPATRHCNGSKSDSWPDRKLRKLGVRFLDPTKDQDYGLHIFEDPNTHELVGASPAGKYHILRCDLNAAHLVQERRDRAELNRLLDQYHVAARVPLGDLMDGSLVETARTLRGIVATMIPPIPPPPGAGQGGAARWV